MSFTSDGGPDPVPFSPFITAQTSAGQMFKAIKALPLSGGVDQFFNFIGIDPAGDDNIAFWHGAYATSLSTTLLTYMQASSGATPPGLGMSGGTATTTLNSLLALAATLPA